MFDVFPDNPSDEEADGVSNLYSSLEHAGRPVNTPIFDAEGRLLYLLHKVEDVTEAIQKKMTEVVGSP